MGAASSPLQSVDTDEARQLGTYLLNAQDALGRLLAAARSDGRHCWAAAVGAVWWVAAIDERLKPLYTPPPGAHDRKTAWERQRHQVLPGEIMGGLLWVRHRHTHDAASTGQGRMQDPNSIPPQGISLVLSAVYRWRPPEAIPVGREDHGDLRRLYEKHVARRELEAPSGIVLRWLEACAPTLGIDLDALRAEPPGSLNWQ